ncbi:NAD-dependent epimerase/dehydratase family protein [Pseudorhodoplanes sinuspersici]|uniref:NAD-dependent dehydratase n=1 Tax=Pseudorhodoplanes sinuspersici TaxID=1235591 RepID=A0A1W6ZRT8_9HYPH|nr:NAD-dependent epimerase/dehydratase family protein [Pseudorhodoplanes sinuspersici]ARP99820.1 NAD-dependent dehydratase [Pseudorhodoplanes sinuspersici]RKE70828.1 UDP-glucose 4-epimerase [Pseudorhodoplanes sinuspersici]
MNESVIALTGATGFIGQYLLRELSRRGYRIRVLLRRPHALPINCASAVIGDLARPINMAAALSGVDTVIHSAALLPTMSGAPESDFRLLNTTATAALARAAQRAGVRRFIFMSSVRAQSGPTALQILTEDSEPKPTDAYGRSKRAAEEELAKLDLDWVALRLALVYGSGVKGNMARLIELARSPYPLPLGGLRARRSLLSLDNLVGAVECVLSAPGPLQRPLIVAEPQPLTVPQMVAAMRRGLGRRPSLIPVPKVILELAFGVAGRSDLYRLLANPLVADPSSLVRLGWAPNILTPDGLAAAARDRCGPDSGPIQQPGMPI